MGRSVESEHESMYPILGTLHDYNGKAMLLLVGDELADLADLNHEWFEGDHLFFVDYQNQRETLKEYVLTVAVMYAELCLHSKY